MQERIVEMLGRGIPANQVASAVGCDDSYISQLLSDGAIAAQVQELRATHFSAYVEQDRKLDDAEAEALLKVTQLVPFITRPAEAVRVYAVLNAAKRRTANHAAAEAPAQTVILDLPTATRVRLTVTHDKQVVEIEGRSMTTMPAKSLAARLEQRNTERMLTTDIPTKLLVPMMRKPSEVPLVEQL